MSSLPQRKKNAEEIAQLRDQLGVPPSVASDPAPATLESAQPSAPSPAPAEQTRAQPSAEPRPSLEPIPDFEAALTPTQDFGFTKTISHEERVAEEQASKLPVKRHSPEELDDLRRREMLTQLNAEPPTNFKFTGAHPALIILGYLMASAGATSFWIMTYPWQAVAGGCAAALLLAGFIALRRPVSRHHAGFISAIALITGVFATIHLFPDLQHAS